MVYRKRKYVQALTLVASPNNLAYCIYVRVILDNIVILANTYKQQVMYTSLNNFIDLVARKAKLQLK